MIGGDASCDAAQSILMVPTSALDPVGRPGVVGGSVSAVWRVSVTRTSSKLMVYVFAPLSPISTRPTGVVPVLATQPVTISIPSR